ncbi:MAG: FRG domain-containing protein [Dehalococcoidia bacterium]|nr:MAG: FRG domain-containing protein [Dehalococcoidia bacterium]
MSTVPYYDSADVKMVTSMQVLLEEIKKFGIERPGGGLYFRGQDDESYPLKPTAGRSNFYKHGGKVALPFTLKQERDLLHRFKRYAYNHTQRLLNDWEALFLARQHGLPVRLLDWTSNPLVALYYAVLCEEEPNKDGAIWIFRRIKDDSRDIDIMAKKRSPFEITGVKIIYPLYVSPRLIVQSGCFTLHHDPSRSLEKDNPNNYGPGDFDISVLRKWVVPSNKKVELLDTLERMAINYRTLFPDLDGLAKGLWQLEVIRKY